MTGPDQIVTVIDSDDGIRLELRVRVTLFTRCILTIWLQRKKRLMKE